MIQGFTEHLRRFQSGFRVLYRWTQVVSTANSGGFSSASRHLMAFQELSVGL